jgi:hypothetical protein
MIQVIKLANQYLDGLITANQFKKELSGHLSLFRDDYELKTFCAALVIGWEEHVP